MTDLYDVRAAKNGGVGAIPTLNELAARNAEILRARATGREPNLDPAHLAKVVHVGTVLVEKQDLPNGALQYIDSPLNAGEVAPIRVLDGPVNTDASVTHEFSGEATIPSDAPAVVVDLGVNEEEDEV